MGRLFLFGFSLAVLGVLVVGVGQVLGINMANVLLGLAAGAILAIVREGSPVARLGAYLIGFFLIIVVYLLRLTLLPQNWAGTAVSIFGLILVLTLISGLTKGRLPLWAMMLGAMVFSAVYEADFWATPWFAGSQIPTLAAATLCTTSAGFMIVLLVEWREKLGGVNLKDPMLPNEPAAPEAPTSAAPPMATSGAPTGAPATGAPTSGGTNPGLQVFDGSQGGQQ